VHITGIFSGWAMAFTSKRGNQVSGISYDFNAEMNAALHRRSFIEAGPDSVNIQGIRF
jgi:hypothetical protein